MTVGTGKPWPRRPRFSPSQHPWGAAGRSRSAWVPCDPRRMRALGAAWEGHRGSLATGGNRCNRPGAGGGADTGDVAPRRAGAVAELARAMTGKGWLRFCLALVLGGAGARHLAGAAGPPCAPRVRSTTEAWGRWTLLFEPFVGEGWLEKDTEGPNDSEKLNAYKKGLI